MMRIIILCASMLLAQVSSQARFKSDCVSCHGTAASFVRNSLELRDGVLYSRNSGSPVSRFLEQHMELSPADIEFFTNLLTRVALEVYRPSFCPALNAEKGWIYSLLA